MEKSNLTDLFPAANQALNNLLTPDIRNQLDRLDEIFQHVENSWKVYLERHRDKEIRYLLIAEAAPWTASGTQHRYFYTAPEGAWARRILKTFLGQHRYDTDTSLSMLADNGFLLVDTLPFALKYSTRIRMGDDYFQLLKASKDHFINKLNNSGLTWHEDVKVALAFRCNGYRVIEAYGRKIELLDGAQKITLGLNESQIAADDSNYTSTRRLREIYGLPDLGV